MKKLIYTIALVAMGMTASYAQNGSPGGRPRERERGTPEERAEKAATALQAKLTLTADQKQKVKAIELERIKKNDEFRKKDEAEMRAKMEQRQAAMKASNDKLDAVLTAEQKKKLEASREELKERMQDRRGRGPRPGTPPQPPANN